MTFESYDDYLSGMKDLIRDLVKNGKDINEVLDMPFHFFLDLVEERTNQIKYIDDDEEAERILDNT